MIGINSPISLKILLMMHRIRGFLLNEQALHQACSKKYTKLILQRRYTIRHIDLLFL